MKKIILIAFCYLVTSNAFAQLAEGFNSDEMRDMIQLCNSYTFLDLYKSDKEIIPKGYQLTYTSAEMGLDNRFQVYENNKGFAVINLRGSTEKELSWLANIYSAMIPASGRMLINKDTFNYRFAKDSAAAVHTGFAIAIGFISNAVLEQIKQLNEKGIYQIMITGHSQGGALAQMLRAYLENNPEVSKQNVFKVYAFANPLIGNKAFVEEYYTRFCLYSNSSFSIVNPDDPVTKMPITSNGDLSLTPENIANLIQNKEGIDKKEWAMSLLFNLFDDKLQPIVNKVGNSLVNRISESVGEIVVPEYVNDVHYVQMPKRVVLEAFDYPQVIDEVKSKESGSTVYKKAGNFYQHKPYNYYVGILKQYYPAQYASIKMKYLPENL